MTITDEQLDEVGKAADSLDNLIAAAPMPLPVATKFQYTLENLAALSAKLKAIYVAVSHENPWEE